MSNPATTQTNIFHPWVKLMRNAARLISRAWRRVLWFPVSPSLTRA
jgi:hypothetical protein